MQKAKTQYFGIPHTRGAFSFSFETIQNPVDTMRPAMKINDIDSYIKSHPKDVQVVLQKLRATIKKAAPMAEEIISYRIPTFRFNGNLVHFGAFKNHIGFYPTSSGIREFRNELSPYKYSRGAIQFPMDKPIPLRLVSKIVRFRVAENRHKSSRL